MQLHPHHRLETELRGQQHRPPHPRSHIHKRGLLHRPRRPRPPPSPHQRLKHRGRNPVVSRVMSVVPMPALQMSPRNQPARPHPKFHVERVPRKPLLHLEPRQPSPRPHRRRAVFLSPVNFHGLNLSTHPPARSEVARVGRAIGRPASNSGMRSHEQRPSKKIPSLGHKARYNPLLPYFPSVGRTYDCVSRSAA